MTGPSDDELLERARAGDRDALETLLKRYQAAVYRFGSKMCRDPEDGKDVLQETLLAAARGVRDFRGASSLSTWLYTIARSYCIKKRRKRKHAPEKEHSLEDVALPAAAVTTSERAPDEALAGKQLEHAIERALSQLEPMYREVLLLRDVEGLAAKEVAEVLGITVQAVKSRLHRARQSVRKQVLPLLGIPEADPRASACPDLNRLFWQRLDGEISADACREIEHHVRGCGQCEQTCEALERTLALCRSTGPGAELPEPVQASVKRALREFLAADAS